MRFKKNYRRSRYSGRRRFKGRRKGVVSKLAALRQTTGIYNLKPSFEQTKSIYIIQLGGLLAAGNYDVTASIDLGTQVAGEQFTNLWRTYNQFRLLSISVDMVLYATGSVPAGQLARNGPVQLFWSNVARPAIVPPLPPPPVYQTHQGAKIFRPGGVTGSKFRFKCVPSKGSNIFTYEQLANGGLRAGLFGFLQYNQEFAYYLTAPLAAQANVNIALVELTYNWYCWDKGDRVALVPNLNAPQPGDFLDVPQEYSCGHTRLIQQPINLPWCRNVRIDIHDLLKQKQEIRQLTEVTMETVYDDEDQDDDIVMKPEGTQVLK